MSLCPSVCLYVCPPPLLTGGNKMPMFKLKTTQLHIFNYYLNHNTGHFLHIAVKYTIGYPTSSVKSS